MSAELEVSRIYEYVLEALAAGAGKNEVLDAVEDAIRDFNAGATR
jgi:hypothetical protein